jgi:hypothetical protein
MEDLLKTLELYLDQALNTPGWTEFDGRKIDLYASSFPKKCNMCGLVYQTREQYLQQTVPLNPDHTASGTIEDEGRVIEYRNCNCGSSLVIVTPCRRDTSPFGIQCRNFFDICVEKLIEESHLTPQEAMSLTRVMFREVFNHCLANHNRAG